MHYGNESVCMCFHLLTREAGYSFLDGCKPLHNTFAEHRHISFLPKNDFILHHVLFDKFEDLINFDSTLSLVYDQNLPGSLGHLNENLHVPPLLPLAQYKINDSCNFTNISIFRI